MNFPNIQMPTQVLGKIERIHFVGIGGTGMSGIARCSRIWAIKSRDRTSRPAP